MLDASCALSNEKSAVFVSCRGVWQPITQVGVVDWEGEVGRAGEAARLCNLMTVSFQVYGGLPYTVVALDLAVYR